MAVLADHLDRAGQELHPNALALGLAQLLLVDDQLGPGSAIDDRDVLGAVAEARPRAVHGRVATADHDHVAAHLELLAEVGQLHEVDAVLDAFQVPAGHVQGDCVHRPGGDRDGIEVALELVELDVLADRRVEHELHAELLDQPDVHLDGLARQAKCRDADQHRAAAVGQAVEDGDLEPLEGELAGDRNPGRAGSDDGDSFLARRDQRDDVGNARGFMPLDEEALHRPDRQRSVDIAAAAGSLARRRADVRAHRRNRVGIPAEDVALLETAFRREVEVAPAVGADRTRLLALDVALEP